MSADRYQIHADELLRTIESYIETLEDDHDCQRSGMSLTIERFGETDCRNKIVVNLQPFREEVWLAAPCGAFHFKYRGGLWLDTRSATEFFVKMSFCLKSLGT